MAVKSINFTPFSSKRNFINRQNNAQYGAQSSVSGDIQNEAQTRFSRRNIFLKSNLPKLAFGALMAATIVFQGVMLYKNKAKGNQFADLQKKFDALYGAIDNLNKKVDANNTQSALNDVQKPLNAILENVNKLLNTQNVAAQPDEKTALALENLLNSIKALGDKLPQGASLTQGSSDKAANEAIQKAQGEIQAKLSQIQEFLGTLSKSNEKLSDAVIENSKTFQNAVETASNAMNDQAKSLEGKFDNLSEKFDSTLDKLQEDLSTLINDTTTSSLSIADKKSAELAQNIQDMFVKIEDDINKMGTEKTPDAVESLLTQLNGMSEKLDDMAKNGALTAKSAQTIQESIDTLSKLTNSVRESVALTHDAVSLARIDVIKNGEKVSKNFNELKSIEETLHNQSPAENKAAAALQQATIQENKAGDEIRGALAQGKTIAQEKAAAQEKTMAAQEKAITQEKTAAEASIQKPIENPIQDAALSPEKNPLDDAAKEAFEPIPKAQTIDVEKDSFEPEAVLKAEIVDATSEAGAQVSSEAIAQASMDSEKAQSAGLWKKIKIAFQKRFLNEKSEKPAKPQITIPDGISVSSEIPHDGAYIKSIGNIDNPALFIYEDGKLRKSTFINGADYNKMCDGTSSMFEKQKTYREPVLVYKKDGQAYSQQVIESKVNYKNQSIQSPSYVFIKKTDLDGKLVGNSVYIKDDTNKSLTEILRYVNKNGKDMVVDANKEEFRVVPKKGAAIIKKKIDNRNIPYTRTTNEEFPGYDVANINLSAAIKNLGH